MSTTDRDRLFLDTPLLEVFVCCLYAALFVLVAGLIWLL